MSSSHTCRTLRISHVSHLEISTTASIPVRFQVTLRGSVSEASSDGRLQGMLGTCGVHDIPFVGIAYARKAQCRSKLITGILLHSLHKIRAPSSDALHLLRLCHCSIAAFWRSSVRVRWPGKRVQLPAQRAHRSRCSCSSRVFLAHARLYVTIHGRLITLSRHCDLKIYTSIRQHMPRPHGGGVIQHH